MIKSKPLLEEEINNSPYFTITGANMESAKETAGNKLIQAIWDYCKNYWYGDRKRSERFFEEYSGEIDSAVFECLKPGLFNPEKGPFLHYLKTSIKHAVFNRKKSEYKIQKNESDPFRFDADGQEYSLIDETASPFQAEVDIAPNEQLYQYFNIIEKYFSKKQERIKPYIRPLLTQDIIEVLAVVDGLPKDYSFIDYKMLEDFIRGGEKPTQRTIAAKMGKLEQAASRYLSDFKKGLRPFLPKNC